MATREGTRWMVKTARVNMDLRDRQVGIRDRPRE
jgi:hypothetical protein